MKVVCDNCRAVYKVPDDKLTKAVNKATCRNCGHRMLIPRPKPNADPEERTLVTAVPPTPVGAPPRAIEPRADGRNEPALGDMNSARTSDAGSRSSGPDDLRISTPIMPSRSVDQTIPGPESDFDGPDTKLAISPGDSDAQKRGTPSLPPARNPPARRPTAPPSVAPPPGAVTPQSGVSQGRRTGGLRDSSSATPAPLRDNSRETPRPMPPARTAPPPRSGAYPAMALHDPASDLNWALLGTATALVGGFLLAFLSIWNHPLVMWFGLAMTFGGSLLTFMVLLTGSRGRRPAKTLLAVLFGGIFAVVTATMMVTMKWAGERMVDAVLDDINFSDVGLKTGISVPTPVEQPPQLASAGMGAMPPAPAPAVAVVEPPAPPPPAPVAQPQPAQPARTPPRPAPAAPAPRVQPPPPPPAPIPAPAPPPAPVPIPIPVPPPPAPTPQPTVGMSTVPMEVIFVMLSNNLEIKKCFVPLMRAGSVPPQVDLKFNIMPEGRATNAMVLQSDYRGTDLEACLVRAVSGITFPPTNGSGTSITFPFVLR